MEIDLNSINCIMFNVENLETPELEIFFFCFHIAANCGNYGHNN